MNYVDVYVKNTKVKESHTSSGAIPTMKPKGSQLRTCASLTRLTPFIYQTHSITVQIDKSKYVKRNFNCSQKVGDMSFIISEDMHVI